MTPRWMAVIWLSVAGACAWGGGGGGSAMIAVAISQVWYAASFVVEELRR